jgi:TldD protein
VRIVERREQTVGVKNGVVESLTETEDHGFGVRVIADGAWGFASSAVLTLGKVERVADSTDQCGPTISLITQDSNSMKRRSTKAPTKSSPFCPKRSRIFSKVVVPSQASRIALALCETGAVCAPQTSR